MIIAGLLLGDLDHPGRLPAAVIGIHAGLLAGGCAVGADPRDKIRTTSA